MMSILRTICDVCKGDKIYREIEKEREIVELVAFYE